MLQIKNIISNILSNTVLAVLVLGSFVLCFGNDVTYAGNPDWIFEDALKEKNIELFDPELITPNVFKEALEDYADGKYRLAAIKFEKIKKLHLPDGHLDFLYFVLGECYKQSDIYNLALENYRTVVSRFPKSNKVAPALFRINQIAYKKNNVAVADSIMNVFNIKYKKHPLYNATVYTTGKLYYKTERYGDAINLLLSIPKSSSYHLKAQFLSALCFVSVNQTDKALLHLDYVRRKTLDESLLSETAIVIGDIYYNSGKLKSALKYFSKVSKDAERYYYALVKIARIYTDLKLYDNAKKIAKTFIKDNSNSGFYFEMASLLEELYRSIGDEEHADKIGRAVEKQIFDARITFDIDLELRSVLGMIQEWHDIRLTGQLSGDSATVKVADKNLKRLENLKNEYLKMIFNSMGKFVKKNVKQLPGMAERRFLDMLSQKLTTAEKKVKALAKTYKASMDNDGVTNTDLETREINKKDLDSAKAELASIKSDYNELRKLVHVKLEETGVFSDEMQTMFIDWSFARYQNKKDKLVAMNKELSAMEKSKSDSSENIQSGVVSMFVSVDRDNLIAEIKRSRRRLISHMQTLINANPNSRFAAQVLMRMAELYYDMAKDNFDQRLQEYENAIAKGNGTTDIPYPEYNLNNVVATYNKIIKDYSDDPVADDAYFYKALSLQQIGKDLEANNVFLALIKKYPESGFFVEANMNVGRYFFEHPKINGNRGYELAEDAFRRVLSFKNHPQFVEALYHLGWCYYMQDSFDEAISVFKYLVEEVDLNFDPANMEENQLSNPLLRDEAIDYIAISFDEEGNLDNAIKFLELIGNPEYASIVLMRIGELREEDLDYPACINVYKRLISEYPTTRTAPLASARLIKVYETLGQIPEAIAERENFFTTYSRGSKWQNVVAPKFPKRAKEVDSMAIAIALTVADEQYRLAEHTNDTTDYRKAVGYYKQLVDAYSGNTGSIEAYWNMVVILDKKLHDRMSAYNGYLAFADLDSIPSDKKERAILNAISIAQGMLPPDSLIVPGKLENPALLVVSATDKYIEYFPNGKYLGDVVLTIGALYFNRKMYANAASAYKTLIDKGNKFKSYYEAMFLTGKCFFAQEKWTSASEAFKVVYENVEDETKKNIAYKLMLQSIFLYANQLNESQAYEKAALAYTKLDVDYPGSEYGDATNFNAAESWEKLKEWSKACKSYHTLYKRYPNSKLAPDALFNAASDYEKLDRYDKAAEVYEMLVMNYPKSSKAKDALFNVGFCYEKLGKLEKMAEANERYTMLYPGEKDVEAMLFRSAKYYFKASMFNKSINVFKNYIRRYPRSPRSVEAMYMISMSTLSLKDTVGAVASFRQTEQQNKRLIIQGAGNNNYFAGEAAYQIAEIKRGLFENVAFNETGKKLDALKEKKKLLLTDAVKAYQRVIKYKSERMFEAGYRIGYMYKDFAVKWHNQNIVNKDPIKLALAKKDLYLVSSSLMQRSFGPYKKILEIAAKVDSMKSDASQWVDSIKYALGENSLIAGEYLSGAISVMNKAPIPKEIKSKPLFLVQYKKQLCETLEPMKIQVRDYYLKTYKSLKNVNLPDSITQKCFERFGRTTYLIGNNYDKLAEDILLSTDKLPKTMDEDEREELIFQFEDIVFELQDKALDTYERGLDLLTSEGAANTNWYNKIMSRLARLDPETYGKSFYAPVTVSTNMDWYVRNDLSKDWNTNNVSSSGWSLANTVKNLRSVILASNKISPIWSSDSAKGTKYFWYPLFLNGAPRDASVYFAFKGPYVLYINQKRISADTSLSVIDSLTSIQSLLKGGDNVIAIEASSVNDTSAINGFALYFTALIDTSEHFKSTVKLPNVPKRVVTDTTSLVANQIDKSDSLSTVKTESKIDYTKEFKNRGELILAIENYQKKLKNTEKDIRRERLEIQKLRINSEYIDKKIKSVIEEINQAKKVLNNMERNK